ncbi:MAG: hypothetical protein Q9P01_13575 [Anaerolineae bacterium]|nr:hypothetical protein [Anaerolineae bacterium]
MMHRHFIRICENPPEAEVEEVAVPSAKAIDSPFTAQLRHFYEAIQNNTQPIVTSQDAVVALEIGLAAIESAKTGKPITLSGKD